MVITIWILLLLLLIVAISTNLTIVGIDALLLTPEETTTWQLPAKPGILPKVKNSWKHAFSLVRDKKNRASPPKIDIRRQSHYLRRYDSIGDFGESPNDLLPSQHPEIHPLFDSRYLPHTQYQWLKDLHIPPHCDPNSNNESAASSLSSLVAAVDVDDFPPITAVTPSSANNEIHNSNHNNNNNNNNNRNPILRFLNSTELTKQLAILLSSCLPTYIIYLFFGRNWIARKICDHDSQRVSKVGSADPDHDHEHHHEYGVTIFGKYINISSQHFIVYVITLTALVLVLVYFCFKICYFYCKVVNENDPINIDIDHAMVAKNGSGKGIVENRKKSDLVSVETSTPSTSTPSVPKLQQEEEDEDEDEKRRRKRYSKMNFVKRFTSVLGSRQAIFAKLRSISTFSRIKAKTERRPSEQTSQSSPSPPKMATLASISYGSLEKDRNNSTKATKPSKNIQTIIKFSTAATAAAAASAKPPPPATTVAMTKTDDQAEFRRARDKSAKPQMRPNDHKAILANKRNLLSPPATAAALPEHSKQSSTSTKTPQISSKLGTIKAAMIVQPTTTTTTFSSSSSRSSSPSRYIRKSAIMDNDNHHHAKDFVDGKTILSRNVVSQGFSLDLSKPGGGGGGGSAFLSLTNITTNTYNTATTATTSSNAITATAATKNIISSAVPISSAIAASELMIQSSEQQQPPQPALPQPQPQPKQQSISRRQKSKSNYVCDERSKATKRSIKPTNIVNNSSHKQSKSPQQRPQQKQKQ